MAKADQQGMNRLGVLASFALIVVACTGGFFFRIVQKQHIPRTEKLADCIGPKLTPLFVVPKGARDFRLVLEGATNFSGIIKVRNSSTSVQEFKFTAATAQQCNWLQPKGYVTARILNWTERPLALAKGSEAQFEILFDATPPTNATLWISYLQRYLDFRKEQREAQR